MSKNRNKTNPEPGAASEAAPVGTPQRVRGPRLRSARDVSHELARLYRECRTRRMDAVQGSKLGYLLNLLRQSLEASDLQTRIEKLEAERGNQQSEDEA